MRKFLFIITIGLGGIILLSNCSKKAKYESMVKEGLESGVRHDTLFLGLYLGMSSEDFYKKCWELNKEGLIQQGSGNTSVLYEIVDEFKAEVEANFYPTFVDEKIYEMPVKFKYDAWAPWNKQFSGDSLQVELLDVFKRWYGSGFIEVNHAKRGPAFVKVDGNRRISIYRDLSADGTVWALYTDLSMKEKVDQIKEETTE